MIEPGNAAFVRYNRGAVDVFDCEVDSPELLIFDAGDGPSNLSLRHRLLHLPEKLRQPKILVIRGMNDFLRHQLVHEDELTDMFPDCELIIDVVADNDVQFAVLRGEMSADLHAALLSDVKNVETIALLQLSDAIWKSPTFHFILPSGEHCDTFVRLADVQSNLINIERLADWCAETLAPNTCYFADTATLLPLIQELQIRGARKYGPSFKCHKMVPKGYYVPYEDLKDLIAESLAWCRLNGPDSKLVFVISVSASGRLARRIKSMLSPEDLGLVSFLVLCNTGSEESSDSICRIMATRCRSDNCELCESGSSAVEIDQQRFTTRVISGGYIIELPKAERVELYTRRIQLLDRAGAIRVHVDRPNHHGHLNVYIDTAAALAIPELRADCEEVLAGLAGDSPPDLVLLPQHSNTDAIRTWLTSLGHKCCDPLPAIGSPSKATCEAIADARHILLCDDAVMTSNTMREMLQFVQRVKGADGIDDYLISGFTLLARTESPSTWNGLRQRFYINHQHRLRAGWVLHLPGPGRNCPWCHERRALEYLLPTTTGDVRTEVEARIAMLSHPEGLSSGIFLGSEKGPIDGFDDGKHVTPQSYYGPLSDVGAYLASIALMQEMRNEWRKRPEALHSRLVLPTDVFLRRYTDPILAAGLLRASKPRELWSAETLASVVDTLREVDHKRQHPVFYAETLWAASRDKLPSEILPALITDEHVDQLGATGKYIRQLIE